MSVEPELREGEEAPPPGVRVMAVVRWILVAAMAALALGSVLHGLGVRLGGQEAHEDVFYCPMHPQIVQDHPGECPICGMTLVRKPPGAVVPSATMEPARAAGDAGADTLYACPMHPHITSKDPDARCSICGMKLEPVPPPKREGVAGLVPVELALDRVQLIGMKTAQAARAPLGGTLRTVGVVQASERGRAQVTTRFGGFVASLAVAETGQKVSRGQVLATIDSPELLQAQEELLTALAWRQGESGPAPHSGHTGGPGALADDARRRLEILGVSPEDIDAIVRERKPRKVLALRSPVGGHVIEKNVVEGVAVRPGMPLFEIADLSTVWVLADVYEADIARVRVGQKARFVANAYPDESFVAKVAFIHPVIDPAARTLKVRLEIKNRPGPAGLLLRPGLVGDVLLDLPSADALVIPAEALVDTGETQYVFVDRGNGRYEPRRVRPGARRGGDVEIREGLAAGERVVTTANFLLDSESRLRAALGNKGATP